MTGATPPDAQREQTSQPAVSVHEALSVPARARLLGILEGQGARDAHELAADLQLHVTTVRFHLDVLAAADLVVSDKQARSGRGRPRLRYRSTRRRDPARGHLMLADTLAAHLGHDPPQRALRAEQMGLAWAKAHPEPLPGAGAGQGLPAAVELVRHRFGELGFDPEPAPAAAGEHVLAFRSCPYMPVPERYPEVTCSLHQGILRGLFTQLVDPAPRVELEPFATPDACLLRVSASTAQAASTAAAGD